MYTWYKYNEFNCGNGLFFLHQKKEAHLAIKHTFRLKMTIPGIMLIT